MFETEQRVFGLAPGVDFPAALVAGLEERLAGAAPEEWARVTVIVNTRRMARRLREIFDAGPPRLLPRILLVTDVSALLPAPPAPSVRTGLRRRLDLMQLVQRVVEGQSQFAPHGSLFDLTDALADLLDEMEAEGVAPEDVTGLDVTDLSGHWAMTQRFVGIARTYLDQLGPERDAQGQARAVIDALRAHWQDVPPGGPVIVAGSTGSRGAVMDLMEAVVALPQGALVLPGFDFDMNADAWGAMDSQDHPQFRFAALCERIGTTPLDVARWARVDPPSPLRARAVSLSLRPAPATDAWLDEGPGLGDLRGALDGVTWLNAESVRDEAQAIALRLRKAAEDGQSAALISPDRMLTRQVTATLDQWGLVPDDSAGTPLHLTPPGRFLRHVAQLFTRRLDAETLLTLLKHPLTASSEARGAHTRLVQALELRIRRKGLPFPDAVSLAGLARDEGWAGWVSDLLCDRAVEGQRPLSDWVAEHLQIAEGLAAGMGQARGTLWLQLSGIAARDVMDRLAGEAGEDILLSARDYADLVGGLLAGEEVRDRDAPHPGVMIWGTIEARVQGADLVILGGMNDGVWPQMPKADPWLNRSMRARAGLLLPERRIGLSAHDYQQAIGAREVWITRAIRSDGAETVPSRWLNRLANLLNGLPDQGGRAAMKAAVARGAAWLEAVRTRERVLPGAPARRPAPRPPVAARPRSLRVTEVQTLKRDPYAIYARHCLGLEPLGPITQTPDALLRGTVLHDVMEAFVRATLDDSAALDADVLRRMGAAHLDRAVPWPAARQLWQARLDRIADWFVTRERDRQADATPRYFEREAKGLLKLGAIGMELRGQADRIDIDAAGQALVYDYKTGKPPSKARIEEYDKQLLIEALMLEEGSFAEVGPVPARAAIYIGLGASPEERAAPLDTEPPAAVKADLIALLGAYLEHGQGFAARNAPYSETEYGDFDHLARFGEWDGTQPPHPEDLG